MHIYKVEDKSLEHFLFHDLYHERQLVTRILMTEPTFPPADKNLEHF